MGEFLPRSCAGKKIQSSGTAMTPFQTPSLLGWIWLRSVYALLCYLVVTTLFLKSFPSHSEIYKMGHGE